MLRIESYVTPIILSYVNKYIKNLKPEDSQVSLWGGEAVFNNLDLRLDVLEQELSLPFTFINGHIHELRIHVPWTKLTSESITITINTIECILKLRDYGADSEGLTHSDSLVAKNLELRRKVKQQELEVPASYIQGLINKIMNNVRVICNNLILKYVEDDIVLSINVKTFDHRTVNGSWLPEFIDLTAESLLLRNLTTLTDLTVCLDKRNAAGKIESYQEPFLYRCSMTCRIIRLFDSIHSTQPSVIRCDVHCPQLHFSLSDTQLPMFLRLLQLLMTLYYGQLNDHDENHSDDDSPLQDEASLSGYENDSWSSWAWSMGSAIMPVYWEEDVPSTVSKQQKRDRIFHFGVYAEIATWIFKLTETSENILAGPTKTKFSPFLRVTQQGSYCNVILKGFEAVNSQVGVSSIVIDPVGCCICGLDDTELSINESTKCGSDGIFAKFGRESREYLNRSLFEDDTLVASRELWNYDYDYENHQVIVTESVLLEKTPAFASDYLYVLELPNKDDLSYEELTSIQENLQQSNVPEHSLCRVAVGPSDVNVTSGFVHRCLAIYSALDLCDYPPYVSPQTDPSPPGLDPPSDDEVSHLEEMTPLRTINIIFIEPKISLFTAQHPFVDIQAIRMSRNRKKKQRATAELCMAKVLPVPCVTLKLSRLELELVKPFYPLRLSSAACRMRIPSASLLHNCYMHSSVKVVAANVSINNETDLPVTIMDSFTCAAYRKVLILPTWFAVPNISKEEITFDTDRFCVWSSMPQIRLISFIVSSWTQPLPTPEELHKNSLVVDAIDQAERFHVLLTQWHSIELKYCQTEFENSTSAVIGSTYIALCYPNKDIHCLLMSGPETPSGSDVPEKTESEKLIQFLMHWSSSSETRQPVFVLSIAKIAILLDPLLLSWLKYTEKTSVTDSIALRKISEMRPVPKVPRKLSDGESSLALDSSSFTVSDTRTSSYLALFITKPKPIKQHWHSKLVNLYPFLANLILFVNIESVTVFLPTTPLNVDTNNGLIETIYRIYLPRKDKRKSLGDTTVILLPKIQLKNASQKCDIFSGLQSVSLKISSMDTLDKLPWSLELSQCHAYSLQSSGPHVRLALMKQCSASATVSLSPKYEELNLVQLGLVVHVDMKPLEIVLNQRQVKSIILLLNNYSSLISIFNIEKISVVPVPVEPILPKKGHHIPVDDPISKTIKEDKKEKHKEDVKEPEETVEEVIDTSNKTSVTAWIQLTLARVTMVLFTPEDSATSKLQADLEELTCSLDIQNVYCKVISKIANFNILHFEKRGATWVPGEYEGTILSTCDHITQNLVVIEPEAKKGQKAAQKPPAKSSDAKSHGFLTLTFTIAESVNVHTKWNQIVKKNFGEERFVKEKVGTLLYEIDVHISRFDVILSPVLDSFLSIFDCCLSLNVPSRTSMSVDTPMGISFNNKNLPLVYLQSDIIRIFFPISTNVDQDLLFMKISSIYISPQVDNPLARLIMREDLYEAAIQARIIGIPGSEIEDRQYQVDLQEITISTGCWADVVKLQSARPRSSSAEIMGLRGENPALEWNNYDPNSSSATEAVFVPLLSRLNVKMIVAPAIVFTPEQTDAKLVLVAGHSIEVNATSDIRFFGSLVQLELLQALLEQAQKAYLSLTVRKSHRRRLSDVTDSGVDCDHIERKDTRNEKGIWKGSDFVPLDFLITGSCVSISFYEKKLASPQKVSRPHLRRKDIASHRGNKVFDIETASTASEQSPIRLLLPTSIPRSYSNASEREDGYDGSEEGSVCDHAQATQRRLFPLVHISLVQPHAFLSCCADKQKLDISVFNLILKGVPTGFSVLASGQKRLPSLDDFSVPWIETKPGDLHPKTGIPPTFFTATISDFLEGGARLNIDMGRPTRVVFSDNKYYQIKHVLSRLKCTLDKSFSQCKSQETTPNDPCVESISKDSKSVLSKYYQIFKNIKLTTDQFVVTIIATKNDKKSELLFSFSGFDIELTNYVSTLTKACWSVRDIQLKTVYHSLPMKPMVSPWSFKGRSKFSWVDWSEMPSSEIQFHSENLAITIGPENIYALMHVYEYLSKFLNEQKLTRTKIRSTETRKSNEFHDDLRAGLFQYDTCNTAPKPYQIIFNKDLGCMTWAYPEARALTKVEIYPVPFIAADTKFTEQHCALQYYDDLLETFVTYHRFQLSESKICRLNLPGIHEKRFLAVSTMWRVCLDYHEDEHESRIIMIIPEALAACIRVDSVFSISNLPTNQSVATFKKIEILLANHMALTGSSLPTFLDRYQMDSYHPEAQIFMTLSIGNFQIRLSSWPKVHHIQVGGSLNIGVTNYKNLTLLQLLEVPKISMDFSISEEDNQDKPSCYEWQTNAKIVNFYLTQSCVHTLMTSKQCWEQASIIVKNPSDGPLPIKEKLPVVMTHTVLVCNDTMQCLTIGQAGTDESILISAATVVCYSWRSHKHPAYLSVKLRQWNCKELINVNDCKTQVLPITRTKGSSSGSLFLVKCTVINHNMITVTITGILTITNMMETDLEFLISDDNQDEWSKHLNSSGVVKAGTYSYSFIGHPTGIRVRSPGALTAWSNEITLDGSKDNFSLKIPSSSKGNLLMTSCHIVRQRMQNVWRLLVMFSASFMVKSHLPRSLVLSVDSTNRSQKVTIRGQGESQAVSLDHNTTHSMTLQLSPDLEASKPPISVTKSILDQVRQTSLKSSVDISEILQTFESTSKLTWPYINKSIEEFKFGDQPKIDLQISFALLHPSCNTVIMDIRPWALLVNDTELELIFTDNPTSEQFWYLNSGTVFAPPKLDNVFYFGISTPDGPFLSSPLQLSKDESWYALSFQGQLPRVGSTNICINVLNRLCYLTVETTYENGIHILHICPTYSISNQTMETLQVKTLSANVEVGCLPPEIVTSYCVDSFANLLMWDFVEEDVTESVMCLQFVKDCNESAVMSVTTVSTDSCLYFTIPIKDDLYCNEPYIVTVHKVKSKVNFVIQKDSTPQMVVTNNTLLPILLAQSSTEEDVVEEELQIYGCPQKILPQRCGYYSFPTTSKEFPRFRTEKDARPRLHLSTPTALLERSQQRWSHGVDVYQKYDQFTVIPGVGDIKIHTENVGFSAHVFIDPASRVEVSPKDIRSRIASRALPSIPTIEAPPISKDRIENRKFNVVFVTCCFSEVSIVLKNDANHFIKEVLRLSIDDFVVNIRPKIDRSEKLRALNYQVQDLIEFVMYAGDLQIDNQLYANGSFDFPVVLIRQKPRWKRMYEHIPILPLSESLCSMSVVIEKTKMAIHSVHVTSKPLMIFLEDALAYSLNEFFKVLVEDTSMSIMLDDIHIKSLAMTNPIRINQLCVDNISIMLSVHASKLLYIALDHSPLEFKAYKRLSIVTTGYSLGHNLTMHYLSSALFKAGWVVSSLDLLGNPGGFARTVATGMKDFVQLPYEGILLGPWAFVAGITNGSLSLVKHLTAGTLVSVTNLASSVARNMERLSMDEEHLIRSEASRRAPRSGLTNGLTQGLSAFGISMLGAIGGIIDQPMQAVLSEDGSPSSLMTGFGKGLLGAVVKPIGGAADLLVHTGQGLLQGAGWNHQYKMRVIPSDEDESTLSNSPLKYTWKFKNNSDIIAFVDATLQAADNCYSPVTIIVDKECVRILAVDKDIVEMEPIHLFHLTCKCSNCDPTLLILEEIKRKPVVPDVEGPPICSERVAEYVRGSRYEEMDVSSLETESSSDDDCHRVKILVAPQSRTFLYSVINLAIRRFKAQGFSC